MTRGLVLFRGHDKEPSMPASRTHFEQIPVEVVKKIAKPDTFAREKAPLSRSARSAPHKEHRRSIRPVVHQR